jgi:hypothetical protein
MADNEPKTGRKPKDSVSKKTRNEARLVDINPRDFCLPAFLEAIQDGDYKDEITIDKKGRYVCQLSDFIVGALCLGVQTKDIDKHDLAKFFIEFTRDGSIRRNHNNAGFAFLDDEGKALIVEGFRLVGEERMPDGGPLALSSHSFDNIQISMGRKRFSKWSDKILYDDKPSKDADNDAGGHNNNDDPQERDNASDSDDVEEYIPNEALLEQPTMVERMEAMKGQVQEMEQEMTMLRKELVAMNKLKKERDNDAAILLGLRKTIKALVIDTIVTHESQMDVGINSVIATMQEAEANIAGVGAQGLERVLHNINDTYGSCAAAYDQLRGIQPQQAAQAPAADARKPAPVVFGDLRKGVIKLSVNKEVKTVEAWDYLRNTLESTTVRVDGRRYNARKIMEDIFLDVKGPITGKNDHIVLVL